MPAALHYQSITQLAAQIKNRDLSPVELVESCLARINTLDSKLHAFAETTAERAMAEARQASTPQRGFQHQARAETPALDAVRRAVDVQVDLIVTPALRDPGTFGQVGRVTAAQLQGERVFFFIEADQPLLVAMQHGAGGHHFGVEQS